MLNDPPCYGKYVYSNGIYDSTTSSCRRRENDFFLSSHSLLSALARVRDLQYALLATTSVQPPGHRLASFKTDQSRS